MPVNRTALELNPPVEPAPLDLPLTPGQNLVDAAEAESLGTLAATGFVDAAGAPAIDPSRLQPQISLAPSSSLFFRVCSESATKAASCTRPQVFLPLFGLSFRVDATGDGTADVTTQVHGTLGGGLKVGIRRLSSSETSGSSLKTQIWVTHDLSASKRVSFGFDGFRRGTTIPQEIVGTFTVNRTLAGQGVFDVGGALSQSGAGTAVAVTTGLTSLAPGTGQPVDPIVASARFSPVPTTFSSHGVVDVGTDKVALDAAAAQPAMLDSISVSRRQSGGGVVDGLTRLTANLAAGNVSAELTRPADGSATLRGAASTGTDNVVFADYGYAGPVLERAARAGAQGLPASFTAAYAAGDDVAFDYAASGPMAALDAGVFDRGSHTAAELSLAGLPTSLGLLVSPADDHVHLTGDQSLGAGSLALSRAGGSFARPGGEHTTLVGDGPAFGASLRVTGLKALDTFFGAHPRLDVEFQPGPAPFVAAGESGAERSRVDLANHPGSMSVDLDPAARTVATTASAGVPEVKAAFTNTATGPTVAARLLDAPDTVEIGYDVGPRPRIGSASSSPIPHLELFASADHIAVLQPASDHYLSVAADDVPTSAELFVDLAARHLEGTMSAPLGGLVAVTRAQLGTRPLAAVLDLDAVPAQFDADFADGQLRLRGLTGPFGAARLAVTNHAGAQVPVGDHLAVHRRQLTGDFDASVSLPALSHAEYSHGTASQRFRLDAHAPAAWLDTDVVMAEAGVDDTRLAVAGRADGLPNTLTVDLTDGGLTYTSASPAGLLAEVRMGKVAALTGLGAPLFENGVALRARGCSPGPGCVADSTPVCTLMASCLGLVGTVQLANLPTEVALRPASHGVSMTGYDGQLSLQLYTATEDLGPSSVEVVTTLAGLPSTLDFDLQEVAASRGHVRVDYTATTAIGALTVHTDGTDTTGRVMRATAEVSPVASSLNASGTFGSFSEVRYVAASPADLLTLQATSGVVGGVASGKAQLTDVPSSTHLSVQGFSDASVLGVPSMTYDGGGRSTLDGSVHVERAMAREAGPAIAGVEEVFLAFTNLGTATTVGIAPDTSVNLISDPVTDSLRLGGRLESSVANVTMDLQVFDQLGFTGTLTGHVGAPTIHVGDLGLTISALRSLALRPGQTAYLGMGIVGDYNVLSIDAADVFIDPDVDLALQVDGPLFLDLDFPFSLQDPFTGVRFHLSDQVMRESGCIAGEVFGEGVLHVRIFTKPGPVATGINHLDVFGVDGPQALSYLDPIPTPLGVDPEMASIFGDLITAYVSDPFNDADVAYDPGNGGC